MKSLVLATLMLASAAACASEVVDVAPLTDQIVLVHLRDGYVVHHKRGQRRQDESVVGKPLDVVAASRPDVYRVTCPDAQLTKLARHRYGSAGRVRGPTLLGSSTDGSVIMRRTTAPTM